MSRANRQKIQLVNYVEDYLDSIESMPLDLQRNVSRMREIDAQYQEILKELDGYYEKFNQETDDTQKRRVLRCIQRALIRSQELGDEKIQIANQMVELVENRNTQLDSHVELLEAHQATSSKAGQDKSKSEAQAGRPRKRSRRQRNDDNREDESNDQDHDDTSSGTPKEKKANTSKRKRSKAKADSEESPADLPVDPNEPTYCLCNQVSYGKMIGCDNDECPFEWFHFPCVGLNHKPKGKWYCPNCRGENAKTMDKALEKSKKERAYNR